MQLAQSGALRKTTSPAPGIDPALLRGSNVNPGTLLASDYLNHFNDAAAVIEMLPHMPECFNEVARWQPRGYCAHFRGSTLRDADIALEAWQHVAPDVKALFGAMVDRLDAATIRAIVTARIALETGDEAIIAESCTDAARELRALIREAGDIVNGSALRRVQFAAG